MTGYYSSRKSQLLDKFDEHCELMKGSLCERYGVVVPSALRSDARQEYERLIPEIPYIKGIRAKALNTFLLVTAQELAVYKAMKRHGKSPQEAWELCHEALRLGLAKMPRWKSWLFRRLMFSKLMRKRMESQAKKQVRFGDFEVQYLVGGRSEFDLGVNYVRCGNHRFAMIHGGEEFAPYICMSDIALSDAMGWGLIRTQTLADGCDHCDFRFKKGGATQISSQTPDVQQTIERIHSKEAKERIALLG
jgi:hypothetical protein